MGCNIYDIFIFIKGPLKYWLIYQTSADQDDFKTNDSSILFYTYIKTRCFKSGYITDQGIIYVDRAGLLPFEAPSLMKLWGPLQTEPSSNSPASVLNIFTRDIF